MLRLDTNQRVDMAANEGRNGAIRRLEGVDVHALYVDTI